MGGTTFFVTSIGETVEEAFQNAVVRARYESGHGGYTGSIAEKNSFTMIPLPAGKAPYDYADELIDKCDKRIDDKWGPAGCFALGDGQYAFFGWASC